MAAETVVPRTAPGLMLGLVTVLAGCSPAPVATGPVSTVEAPARDAATRRGVVERVVDGDTVLIQIGAARERVRLLGVDAPESVKPDSPVECFGPEASAHLKAILPAGAAVSVVTEGPERDEFGRLLAYVTEDGQSDSVNLQQVREGFAEVFRKAPAGARRRALDQAGAAAKAKGLGLWKACGSRG